MTTPDLPRCEKSGLLRSRCRCSDRRCYGRPNAHERRESGGARRLRIRRQKKREAVEEARRNWTQNMWTSHALAHPDMWSPGYAEQHPLKGPGYGR